MKNFIKKASSLLLSVVMAATAMPIAFAEVGEGYFTYPNESSAATGGGAQGPKITFTVVQEMYRISYPRALELNNMTYQTNFDVQASELNFDTKTKQLEMKVSSSNDKDAEGIIGLATADGSKTLELAFYEKDYNTMLAKDPTKIVGVLNPTTLSTYIRVRDLDSVREENLAQLGDSGTQYNGGLLIEAALTTKTGG